MNSTPNPKLAAEFLLTIWDWMEKQKDGCSLSSDIDPHTTDLSRDSDLGDETEAEEQEA
jgi:hypothetical protein